MKKYIEPYGNESKGTNAIKGKNVKVKFNITYENINFESSET
jgi:hypothetical protein